MKRVCFFVFIFSFLWSIPSMAASDLNMDLYESIKIVDSDDMSVNLANISKLLAEGADPNWVNQENKVHSSILGQFVTVLSLANPKDYSNYTAGLKAVKLLFSKGAKLQYCDRAILFFPIAQSKYDLVEVLLENGADAQFWPNIELGTNYSPLETALLNNDEATANLLLKHGAKPVLKKDEIQVRFLGAIKNGQLADIKKLAKLGAGINAIGKNNETPLMFALSNLYTPEMYEKIETLIELGANVNSPGKGMIYKLPLHQAVVISSIQFKRLINEQYAKKVIQTLISRGAHVSKKDENDITPLHVAAKFDNYFAANELLKADAKVMDRNEDGKTPLDLAETSEMIKLLKKYGAKE